MAPASSLGFSDGVEWTELGFSALDALGLPPNAFWTEVESLVDGRDVDCLAGRLTGCDFLGGVVGVLSLVFDWELAVGRIIRAMNPSFGAGGLAVADLGRPSAAPPMLGFAGSFLAGGGPMADLLVAVDCERRKPALVVGATETRL